MATSESENLLSNDPARDETYVEVEVEVCFSYDGTSEYKTTVETGYSIRGWNELTDHQRIEEMDALVEEVIWDQLVGAARVITEGAAE